MSCILFSRIFGRDSSFSIQKSFNLIQTCGYAARKGTRERKKKKQVKAEVKKVEFVPYKLREKSRPKSGPHTSRRIDDSFKPLPADDVVVGKFHQWKIYSFKDAVQCHRESHHPQILNSPNAPLHALIELDMRGAKKNKFVDSFTRIAKAPYPFDHGEDRSILVFCKTPELKSLAEESGATLVGDVDIIKKVEKGDIVLPDFQFILAHPNILPELVSLRGLLKKKFPNIKQDTLSPNIGDMVSRFKTGIHYSALRDEIEQDYGLADAVIGTLDMKIEHLEENMKSIIDDIGTQKPKRSGPFITRILLKCPPLNERFKLELSRYLDEEEDESGSDTDEEEISARA